jgi:hypothetical protein
MSATKKEQTPYTLMNVKKPKKAAKARWNEREK